MQAIKQILNVPASRELVIHLPADATVYGTAEVIVLFQTSPNVLTDKFAVMKEAMNDPLFLADLDEVAEDFQYIDSEVIAA